MTDLLPPLEQQVLEAIADVERERDPRLPLQLAIAIRDSPALQEMQREDVERAARRLLSNGYLQGKELQTFEDYDVMGLSLTERGLRTAGEWPQPDDIQPLLRLIEDLAVDADSPAQQSGLRQVAAGLREAGTDMALSVARAWAVHLAGPGGGF